MDCAEKLRSLYTEYLDKVDRLLKESKPADGLLGMGKAPQHDACHDWFDQQVAEAVQGAQGQEREVVAQLLFGEQEYAAPSCASWMLVAVQRHALPLIPALSGKEAAELMSAYGELYSFFSRLPMQKEILAALKKQSG